MRYRPVHTMNNTAFQNAGRKHYATAMVARLVEAADRVQATHDRTSLLRVVNG